MENEPVITKMDDEPDYYCKECFAWYEDECVCEPPNPMKKELTIKELAPYLPYKLQIQVKTIWPGGSAINIETMELLTEEALTTENNDCFFHDPDGDTIWKPLLRNLTSLTKEIEHNGERFVPLDQIQKEVDWCDAYTEWWDYQEPNFDSMMMNGPYEVIQILLSWHFDVFGLIPSGLAIEKT